MSFGGSASAMQQSVKANLALRRGRNHLFDRTISGSWGDQAPKLPTSSVDSFTRQRNQEKLRHEQRLERNKLLASVLLAVGLIVLLYCYGGVLVDLIVYQPGTP